MLSKRLIAFLLVGCAGCLAGGGAHAAYVQDLVRMGQVAADVTFFDAAAGDNPTEYTAIAVFENRTANVIEAVVPVGLELVAIPGHQDRIVAKDRPIHLEPYRQIEVTLYNYCTEHNEYISAGEPLTLGAITPNQGLLRLLQSAANQIPDEALMGLVQEKVWAITEAHRARPGVNTRPTTIPGFGAMGREARTPPVAITTGLNAAIILPIVAWAVLILGALLIAAIYSLSKARIAPKRVEIQPHERPGPPPEYWQGPR